MHSLGHQGLNRMTNSQGSLKVFFTLLCSGDTSSSTRYAPTGMLAGRERAKVTLAPSDPTFCGENVYMCGCVGDCEHLTGCAWLLGNLMLLSLNTNIDTCCYGNKYIKEQ